MAEENIIKGLTMDDIFKMFNSTSFIITDLLKEGGTAKFFPKNRNLEVTLWNLSKVCSKAIEDILKYYNPSRKKDVSLTDLQVAALATSIKEFLKLKNDLIWNYAISLTIN